MRFVGKIAHPQIGITVFHMNDKYVLKLEAGPMEQTFKFSEDEVKGMDDIIKIVSPEFISTCIARFNDMYLQMSEAKKNHGS